MDLRLKREEKMDKKKESLQEKENVKKAPEQGSGQGLRGKNGGRKQELSVQPQALGSQGT